MTLQEFIEKAKAKAKAKQAEKQQLDLEAVKAFMEKLKINISPKESSETPLE
jgi:hypothetical protein